MARTKRRLILGVLAVFLLIFLYRLLTVYTVRSGECRPRPVDPSLRLATRDEHGAHVSFPERIGFPPQRRPLVVLTYNIAGHDELIDSDHVQRIADAIRRLHPDVVALQEVHRGTWQARFHDQLAELEAHTGLHGFFVPSYVQWGGGYGNAILTRGEIVHAEAHSLPCIGEPRALLEATIRIDQATISFFATHLTTWGRLNSTVRAEQLDCLAREVRTSRYPYILAGDFNTHPEAPEMEAFRRENAAQLATKAIGPTFPRWKEQIDYIFADYGWKVRAARTWPIEVSDHLPVTAELLW
ncbi:MAG TPA: endonuclease/exonuclease/phosphatase family protein [Thermoanaerobaculia bacterium]|nr:endonuclease/exonuclease/phosphatase family protein [Thermoanaerobaculia bacterium]